MTLILEATRKFTNNPRNDGKGRWKVNGLKIGLLQGTSMIFSLSLWESGLGVWVFFILFSIFFWGSEMGRLENRPRPIKVLKLYNRDGGRLTLGRAVCLYISLVANVLKHRRHILFGRLLSQQQILNPPHRALLARIHKVVP